MGSVNKGRDGHNHSTRHDLRDDLVYDIATRYRPEVRRCRIGLAFGDKRDDCCVQLLEKLTGTEKLLDSCNDIRTRSIPRGFKE